MFRKYVSNVPVGTGNNFIIQKGEPVKFRARAYFRPTVYGSFTWRFFFSNTVDSTFADGRTAYRGRSGGNWRILSASLSKAPDSGNDRAQDVLTKAAPLTDRTAVTFDGSTARDAAPDERFWSDPVSFTVEEGSYLVWEWELEGDGIPFTPDSQLPVFTDWGSGWKFTTDCPLPALLGCDRQVRKRICFLSDSITQGCGTAINGYEMWAAKIAKALGGEYAVWNLGLGYGRGSDCASDGSSWLYKAKQCDTAVLAFGVNDLESGAYGRGRGDTAEEFLETTETIIRLLENAGVEVIAGTIPPFSFRPAMTEQWRAANLAILAFAEREGRRLFDIERALDASPDFGNQYQYGAHPDGRGGTAAAEAFLAMWNRTEKI